MAEHFLTKSRSSLVHKTLYSFLSEICQVFSITVIKLIPF